MVYINWWLDSLLIMLPAYFANMAPVFMHRFNILGLKTPIDGGRKLKDGTRLFGDGKTWQGVVFAVSYGAIIGYLLGFFGISSLLIGAVLGFFAILGDLAGSFIKRRLKLKRGQNAGLLDSMDFILFALAASFIFYQWEIRQILLLLIINPVLHRSANITGYFLKLKDVPW